MSSCPICCETFTAAKRKEIQCPYCRVSACVECCQKFILDSANADASCMSCRALWNREFLDLTFTKAFIGREYRAHRERVLFEREYAMLPASQFMVEHWKRAQELRGEIPGMNARIAELKAELETLTNQKTRANNELRVIEMHEYRRGLVNGDSSLGERRQFVKACPAETCRGFLSTAWKCGTCNVRVCPDCHVIKEGDAHVCNPDDVATATLLRKDTKGCPSCATMITKIDGCFAGDTVIPMYDGTSKYAKDIRVGDVIIGDDGEPRNVLHTMSGFDTMYEVSQKNGASYTVNSKHKLVLKFSGECVPYWSEKRSSWMMWRIDPTSLTKKYEILPEKILIDPPIHEITVEDFLKMSPSVQKEAMGFKSGGIQWEKKEVLLDPYMLGLWLGDGIHTGDCISASDPEILDYIYKWCCENNAELVHEAPYKFRIRRAGGKISKDAIGRGSTCESCAACSLKKYDICDTPIEIFEFEEKKINPLKYLLGEYNLIKNKHVPTEYITNDTDARLKLLAGFIDSDGYVGNDGKRIVIIQKNKEISDNIIFLARSLGFSVHVTFKTKKNITFPGSEKKTNYEDQYCINISGKNASCIPTLISRKKCMDSNENKDSLRTGISITKKEKDEYFGWTIDGNKRFILTDCTVVRNCDQMWCTQCHTAFSWRTGAIETSVVHNPHFYEWQRRQNGGVAPRVPGDNGGGCGNAGLMPIYLMETHPVFKKEKHEIRQFMRRTHRLLTHTEAVTIQAYRNRRADNADLRLYYLVGAITEKDWKQKLHQREKKAIRNDATRQVIEAFVEVGKILFGDFLMERASGSDVVEQIEKLIDYTNENITALEKRFSVKIEKLTTRFV